MKNKINMKIMAPFIAILITFAISLVLFPVVKGAVKDLPITVVSLDQGVTTPQGEVNLGPKVVAGITAKLEAAMASQARAPIKVIEITNQKMLDNAFKDRDIYAAIVIPKDFTALQLAGETPAIKVIIDEGQSKAIATVLSTLLTSLSSKSEVPLTMEYLHKVDSDMSNGNANMYAFMLAWIATQVCSIVLARGFQDERAQTIASKIKQISMAAVTAIVIAASVTFILKYEFSLGIEFGTTFGYLSIAVFCLMMLILGVMSWSFIGGLIIFVLLMLLGLVASNMPYEILPTFWQNYVYPWIPMRFMSDGIKEIFYLDGGVWNTGTKALIWFGTGGILLTFLAVLKGKREQQS